MADFESAFKVIILNEGVKFTDNPSDPGGATKYGISLKFYKLLDPTATKQTIMDLNLDDARAIYKKEFWDKNKYAEIISQSIAAHLFDLCVNVGEFIANSCMQRAAMNVGKRMLVVDGKIGPKTLTLINFCPSDLLLEAFRTYAKRHYEGLVLNNPKLNVFIKGWLNRLNQNY